jgi:hypothetical protein
MPWISTHQYTQLETSNSSGPDPPPVYDVNTVLAPSDSDARYQFTDDELPIFGGVAQDTGPVVWDDWWPLDDNYVNHDNLTGDFDADLQLLLNSAVDTRILY